MNDQMNEETLILYYYNDSLTDAERSEVEDAMRNDEALQQRYQALTRDLDKMREPADLPIPAGLQYRLQSALDRAVRLEASHQQRASWLSRLFTPRNFALGTALGTVLAVGIGIGVWVSDGDTMVPQIVIQTAPTVTTGTPEWSQTAFQRGLESHFRSSRLDVADLSQQAEHDQEALVASLITQNRLYAELAMQNDSPDLARVLRSFEPILVRLGSADLSAQEAVDLQAKLQFEFTVMLTKLTRQPSQQTEPNNQEIEL